MGCHPRAAHTSDLAQFNGELVFGGPPECPNRKFCLIGLTDVYGLDFAALAPPQNHLAGPIHGGERL